MSSRRGLHLEDACLGAVTIRRHEDLSWGAVLPWRVKHGGMVNYWHAMSIRSRGMEYSAVSGFRPRLFRELQVVWRPIAPVTVSKFNGFGRPERAGFSLIT